MRNGSSEGNLCCEPRIVYCHLYDVLCIQSCERNVMVYFQPVE